MRSYHLLQSRRRADGSEGPLAADALSPRQAAVLSSAPGTVLCRPQAQSHAEQEVAADATQQCSNQCTLLDYLAAGVDVQCVQGLLADLTNARDLQYRPLPQTRL